MFLRSHLHCCTLLVNGHLLKLRSTEITVGLQSLPVKSKLVLMLAKCAIAISKIDQPARKRSYFTCIRMVLRSFLMSFIYSSDVKLKSKRFVFGITLEILLLCTFGCKKKQGLQFNPVNKVLMKSIFILTFLITCIWKKHKVKKSSGRPEDVCFLCLMGESRTSFNYVTSINYCDSIRNGVFPSKN